MPSKSFLLVRLSKVPATLLSSVEDVSRLFNGASETFDAIEVPIWGGPIHLIYVQSTEHDDRSLSSKLKVTNYALPPKQQLSTLCFLTAHLPIAQSFGFTGALRAATHAKAFPQTVFSLTGRRSK